MAPYRYFSPIASAFSLGLVTRSGLMVAFHRAQQLVSLTDNPIIVLCMAVQIYHDTRIPTQAGGWAANPMHCHSHILHWRLITGTTQEHNARYQNKRGMVRWGAAPFDTGNPWSSGTLLTPRRGWPAATNRKRSSSQMRHN